MRTPSSRRSILLVSNTFSAARGSYGSVARDFADRLSQGGWMVFRVSEQSNRWVRFPDIVWSTWAKRRQYSVAQVDVFSGPAFLRLIKMGRSSRSSLFRLVHRLSEFVPFSRRVNLSSNAEAFS